MYVERNTCRLFFDLSLLSKMYTILVCFRVSVSNVSECSDYNNKCNTRTQHNVILGKVPVIAVCPVGRHEVSNILQSFIQGLIENYQYTGNNPDSLREWEYSVVDCNSVVFFSWTSYCMDTISY